MKEETLEMRPAGTFFRTGFIEYCNFLRDKNVQRLLEIGSYAGESALLLKEFLGQNSIIICIDPFFEMNDDSDILKGSNFKIIERRFNDATISTSNIGKFKFRSEDIFELFSDKFFDAVYIDGLHTYDQVLLDIDNYLPKIKSGGIISGHDFEIPWTQEQEEFFYNPSGVKAIRNAVTSAVLQRFKREDIIVFPDSSWATTL